MTGLVVPLGVRSSRKTAGLKAGGGEEPLPRGKFPLSWAPVASQIRQLNTVLKPAHSLCEMGIHAISARLISRVPSHSCSSLRTLPKPHRYRKENWFVPAYHT